MSKKGLVISVEANRVMVLTGQGEFKECTMSGVVVGEEITLPAGKALPRWLAAAAVLILLFSGAAGIASLLPSNSMAYAVSMDINPSLEMVLNKSGRVSSATALNDDGEKLLEQADIVGDFIKQAVEEVLVTSKELGYLGVDGAVVFGVTAVDQQDAGKTELTRNLKTAVQKTVPGISVGVVGISEEARQTAKSMGLSPGKYAILLSANEQGLDVSADSLKRGSIAQVIKQAGGTPGEVIRRAEANKRLEKKPHPSQGRDKNKPQDKAKVAPGKSKKEERGGSESKSKGVNSDKDRLTDNKTLPKQQGKDDKDAARLNTEAIGDDEPAERKSQGKGGDDKDMQQSKTQGNDKRHKDIRRGKDNWVGDFRPIEQKEKSKAKDYKSKQGTGKRK